MGLRSVVMDDLLLPILSGTAYILVWREPALSAGLLLGYVGVCLEVVERLVTDGA